MTYLLEELGFDAAFNYKDGPVPDLLRDAAPEGIDVYFDNVGGDHLEAALAVLRKNGRIVICGAISEYARDDADSGARRTSSRRSRTISRCAASAPAATPT